MTTSGYHQAFKDPADQEWYEERAAILEYDALMSRPRAEAQAQLLTWQMIVKKAVTGDG